MEPPSSANDQALQRELDRISVEARAFEGAYKKMKTERDRLVRELEDAHKQISILREDLSLREKMYLDLKERTDREIAQLNRTKQDLELRLRSVLESHQGGIADLLAGEGDLQSSEPMLSTLTGAGLPNLTASEVVEALGKWEGMEDTIVLFKEQLEAENETGQWMPGSPWTSRWKFVLTVYVCAPADMHSAVDSFMEDHLPLLTQQCREGGCYLTVVHMNTDTMAQVTSGDEIQSFVVHQIENCDIFVCLLKSSADLLTKLEIEHGFLNNPNTRYTEFLFLTEENGSSVASKNARKLKERVRKIQSSKSNIMACDESVDSGLVKLRERLQVTLKKEFGVLEPVQDGSDAVMERIGLLEDMRWEREQQDMFAALIANAPPTPIAMDEVFDRLDGYLEEEGPVATYLVTGLSGMGKSTLAAKWVEKLQDKYGENIFVLYHFVRGLCSSSAESTLIYRRFIQKIMYYCKESGPIPSHPVQLDEGFTSWLEKLSTNLEEQSEKAVIVIDGVDLITDCEKHLGWMLKPLPKNLRAILTATNDNYPDAWRALPSPTLPTPTLSDLSEIITAVQERQGVAVIEEEQAGLLGLSAPSLPLWSVLATKHILSTFSHVEDPLKLDEVIESFENFQEIPDLIQHVLETIAFDNQFIASCLEKVLQLIYWSRNGLTVCELSQLTALPPCALLYLLRELKRRAILAEIGGLYHLSHDQVQEGVHVMLSCDPSCEYMLLWTDPLVTLFSELSSDSSLVTRCAEELPWLLKRAELKEQLFHAILNMDVLLHLYSSGRTGELLAYWEYLRASVTEMALQYRDALARSEEEEGETAYIASLYETTGKVLRNLGFLDEALPSLQHALELCESLFDPDGVEVAMTMCELASLHYVAGRYSTSEGYYNQALQIFELTYGEESAQAHKVLKSLGKIYEKQGKNDMADAVIKRAFAIKQNRSLQQTPSSILRSRFAELDSFCSNEMQPVSLELVRRTNELAVINTIYADSGVAEERFLESLQLVESLPPEDSYTYFLAVLKNLGSFYMQFKKFDLTAPLYEKAYDVATKYFPEGHSQISSVVENLALLYRSQGNLEEAEMYQRELLRLKILELGEEHLSVGKVMNNLAVLYCLQGNFEQAVPYFTHAIEIYEVHLGRSDPTVETAIKNKELAVSKLQSQTDQDALT